ncbi:uncharacterized protein LOC132271939 [Cornus florida]|uniref:uncharacterized protein LOC132271939 n=1 Tax=Cornus florida TaxID=4283 RepID=UPI0028A1C654|nr:uncharacterized protein LOC132271939 [Cornus florida]
MDTSEEPMRRVLRSRRAETERPSTSSPPTQPSGLGEDRNSTNERMEGDGSNEQIGPQPSGEGYIKPVGLNNKLWTAEVGINTRDTEALLKYKTWRDVPDFEKEVCYDHLKVKLKERQSQEDEDGEREEDPAIRLYKDTHFKEQGGWAHEKAKRNFDAMKEKAAQNSQNSDGTSPSINDVEIVQNQLGIRKGYCRGFGHGFVAPKRQRASSSYDEASRKRAEIAEERSVQTAEKMEKLEKMLEQYQQQPPPWFL